jgi:hypothetical protein
MSTYRGLVLALLAFAVSLGAVGVGGGTAWVRCGRGSDCTGDLALGVAAAAPAALLLSVMTLLLRTRTSSALLARLLLVGAVGLAAAPLAAFVVRDQRTVVAVGVLAAALVYLTLMEDTDPDAGAPNAQGATWRQDTGKGMDSPPVADTLEGEPATGGTPATAAAEQLSMQPAEQRREAAPATVSLCLLGVRDFEQLVEIYETLCRHPETTAVVVRRFAGALAWLELTVRAPVSWDSLVDALPALVGAGLDPSHWQATGGEGVAGDSPPSDVPAHLRSGVDAGRQPLRWRSRR